MNHPEAAHALGVATGRRELAEQLVAELRRASARWRAADAQSSSLLGALRAAFLWSVTERWCARIEELASAIEARVAELRTAEQTQRAFYEQSSRPRKKQ